MPDITAQTPRAEITIAGKTFSVPRPYAAGYVLNENEASALNQTFAENLRNNLAKHIKENGEGQDFVDSYADEYEFGIRTGGFATGDPVKQEAMEICRQKIRSAIRKKGGKLADYKGKEISEMAAKHLAAHPEIMDVASKNVELARSVAEAALP